MLEHSQYNYKPPLGSTLNLNHPLATHVMLVIYLMNKEEMLPMI